MTSVTVRRVFLDTNVLLGGLQKQARQPEVQIRRQIETGVAQCVLCLRAIREALITIGQNERWDPLRLGYAYIYWVVSQQVFGQVELVPDPDKLQVLAARRRVADPDDAWWIVLAEREGIPIVTEDRTLRQAQASVPILSCQEWLQQTSGGQHSPGTNQP